MSKTNSYTVQVEDQIFRFTQVTVRASSAAEAALIARRMAYQGELEMSYQAHRISPTVYSVEGGKLPYTDGANEECLCDRIAMLLEREGLPAEMAEAFDEYEDDIDETGYEGS